MTYDLVDAGGTDQFGWRFEDGDMFWHDYVNNVDVIQYDRSEGAWIPADGGASLGTSANPWSKLTTEFLGGDLVNRVEDINHLEGNIYLTEEGAPDPTENDGDLWFEYESE